jgi:endonuclease III
LETFVDVRVVKIIRLLQEQTREFARPMAFSINQIFGQDPFTILISCLLSLRARDKITFPVVVALLRRARTPQAILAINKQELEALLRPIGLYRTKALTLHTVCKQLLEEYGGTVPSTYQELRQIWGVGPKTANLVLAEGFNIPALCVDTHVHRISNHLGLVWTKRPEETERALAKLVPVHLWREINYLLVMWGQNKCKPISPTCPECTKLARCASNKIFEDGLGHSV